jgi:hypothetical protein
MSVKIAQLHIPLLVHVTRNDEDVNIEEDMQIVDALRSRKPFLAETKVYDNQPGRAHVRSPGGPEDLAAREHARPA